MFRHEYPRFQRRGDELVKVGWSKKDRREYHHRAPKRAVEALLAAIQRLAPDGSVFTSDQFQNLQDPATGNVFPSYQLFVALAWLRQLELVQQHGRKGGYSLQLDKPLEATIAIAFKALPA
jgi:hypothetical protein